MNRSYNKKIQIYSEDNKAILKMAGVQRVHKGWYTVIYNGAVLDKSTVISAVRNKNGEIQYPSN